MEPISTHSVNLSEHTDRGPLLVVAALGILGFVLFVHVLVAC